MRIFVAIPHYFRVPKDRHAKYSSEIEPLSRIAGLNAAIVALHRNFGSNRLSPTGEPLPDSGEPYEVDIAIVVSGDDHLLAEVGLDPSIYSVVQAECHPMRLPFEANRVLGERLGAYDYYCYVEDDVIVYDREFFAKLEWFANTFGTQAMLAPVRFEMSSTGIPAKVITDPLLPAELQVPFRRPGQRQTISAPWHGVMQEFEIPANPHAASYFLSQDQLAYWVRQPSYSDHDESWVGPLESAATFSTGRAFDIYKPMRPDPFFLEVEHYGTRYAQISSPRGRDFGDPPLLAIAQGALRELARSGIQDRDILQLSRRWLAHGSSVDQLSRWERDFIESESLRKQSQQQFSDQIGRLERDLMERESLHRQSQRELIDKISGIETQLTQERALRERQLTEEKALLAHERNLHEAFERSPRRLCRALLKAAWSRVISVVRTGFFSIAI